jgi:hypothetical protein
MGTGTVFRWHLRRPCSKILIARRRSTALNCSTEEASDGVDFDDVRHSNLKNTNLLVAARAAWLIALSLALHVAPVHSQAPAQSAADRQSKIDLGKRHASAEALYEALLKEANGGDRLTAASVPDWSGVWSRPIEHIGLFDSTQNRADPPTAKLTPQYQAMLDDKLAKIAQGNEYDRLGRCDPPGHPRWLVEPFLREFIVTPKQTWLVNEVANEIRRVYTDGRPHIAAVDRFPTWDGDSIGFWDDGKLVVHTNQLSPGQYTRGQPDYSEQIETVEIWQRAADGIIAVDVWAYDPPALREPWYVRQYYERLSNEDQLLRIHYWHCFENQNNDVVETNEGGTDFPNFTFTKEDDGGNAPSASE